MSLYTLSSLGRTLAGIANPAAGRTALLAAAAGANTDITSITGSAAKLTTARNIVITGDLTYTVSFDGSGNVSGVGTLAASGVGAGTYGSVTVNAKGLVTSASVATPIANGGTGQTTQSAALTALLGASAVPVANGGTGATTQTAARTALQAASSGANTDITSITGSAATLTTSRSIAASGDATWTVNFNGSANVTAALTLASVGSAGTYGSVTTDAKGRVTSGSVATPVANGGTGAITALAAGTNLGTSTVGDNTDQLARSSMIQNEIANKRAWTSYTPTITAASGSWTSVSVTGKYMVAFGICHIQVVITITTRGTGANPVFTLPFPALSGSNKAIFPATETNVNGKSGMAKIPPGLTTATVYSYDALDLVTADGAIVSISGSYPIA